MPSIPHRPDISVLMPAYNAERFIRQSVQSVLAQTLDDFELLVVDDGSTDSTLEILDSFRDPRLRVLRNATNLGVVGALNLAMAEARGRLIARIDADDLCHPTRFAHQRAFLAAHPDILMVGTAMSVLEAGRIRFTRPQADPDPLVLRWMLHLGNPIGHPSMMFRADAVSRLDRYLQEPYRSAEDFDFTHRLLAHGDVAVLPEHLVIYRQHAQSVTRVRRDEMTDRTAAVLRRVHADLLGSDPEDSHLARDAALVATHLIARHPVPDATTLAQLGAHVTRLLDAFLRRWNPDERQRARIRTHTGLTWWRSAEPAIAEGRIGAAGWRSEGQPWAEETRPPRLRVACWRAAGLARAILPTPGPPARPATSAPRRIALAGVPLEEEPVARDDPPSLYVVVDTEAEFDWGGGFDRSLTRVTAMREQHHAQAVFEAHGARPIYVIDHPVASQPEGWEPLRDILARRAGVVGAHLHPWVNPPFEEPISDRNSFAGNLPPELEARKLRALVDAIEASLGVRPLFFKAGRYGLGPRTFRTLAQLGIAVDFSILPLADLRPRGGPDFRTARARPYRAADGGIRTIPMSRTQLGLLPGLPPALLGALQSERAARLHVPGMLARIGLANLVTLTPEGVPVPELLRLIDTLVRRGQKTLVLHYHSPSLGMLTPYVRTPQERAAFLGALEAVCRFFFGTIGGLPGHPADLLPPQLREALWPGPPTNAGAAP